MVRVSVPEIALNARLHCRVVQGSKVNAKSVMPVLVADINSVTSDLTRQGMGHAPRREGRRAGEWHNRIRKCRRQIPTNNRLFSDGDLWGRCHTSFPSRDTSSYRLP
jgi:hypothetical protein